MKFKDWADWRDYFGDDHFIGFSKYVDFKTAIYRQTMILDNGRFVRRTMAIGFTRREAEELWWIWIIKNPT